MAVTERRASAEDRLKAALWFAERGFGVFSVWSTNPDGSCRCRNPQCESPGKHPIPTNGFKAATTDPGRIRAMLAVPSDPNWGMLPPEGVFVLDVDGEGIAHLAELEALHGPLPATLRTNTANGQHIFLRWPEQLPRPIGQLFGFVTRWGSGHDTGYVIGPRSIHHSGAEYAPASDALEIAEIPDAWARAAVGRPDALITITGGGYQLPERVGAGESRYEAIRAYTAHLYNTSRLATADMWLLVRDRLAPRFAEPLSEPELRARFERVTSRLEERLGERRAVPPEPVDPATFPLPEDRGTATLSPLGDIEYVEDLVRPGRIVVWAAEEGSGKSYAVSGELAIRSAVAGGTFAGTWPVLVRGPVLVLSEMHPDDDYVREDVVLSSLGLKRSDIRDRYFRLDLMTAAGGRPALTVPEWREWITAWLEQHEAILLVVDTATGATQVDPWGREIQAVYSSLRVMLAEYPRLAVILIVHLKKPQGGERGISDVLGEWGRWCDVVVLQENEKLDLSKAKLTVRKRVRRERRVVVGKHGGLLVDPMEIIEGLQSSKVPVDEIVETIREHPDLTFTALGKELGVSRDTAASYVTSLGSRVVLSPGPRGSKLIRLAAFEGDTRPAESSESTGSRVVLHTDLRHPQSTRSSSDPRPAELSERAQSQVGVGWSSDPRPTTPSLTGGEGERGRGSRDPSDDLSDSRVCATCGSAPTGAYPDGSPRYTCGPHSPIQPEASA